MREIKFRVWDEEKKEMYIQGMNTTENNWIMECMFILDNFGIVPYVRGYNLEDFVQVKDYEIMQYTGLKDKNGKEIYEGDIISLEYFLNNNKGIVKFGKYKQSDMSSEYECGNQGFYIDVGNGEYDLYRHDLWFYNSHCKVIGNIYQKPELLKV